MDISPCETDRLSGRHVSYQSAISGPRGSFKGENKQSAKSNTLTYKQRTRLQSYNNGLGKKHMVLLKYGHTKYLTLQVCCFKLITTLISRAFLENKFEDKKKNKKFISNYIANVLFRFPVNIDFDLKTDHITVFFYRNLSTVRFPQSLIPI